MRECGRIPYSCTSLTRDLPSYPSPTPDFPSYWLGALLSLISCPFFAKYYNMRKTTSGFPHQVPHIRFCLTFRYKCYVYRLRPDLRFRRLSFWGCANPAYHAKFSNTALIPVSALPYHRAAGPHHNRSTRNYLNQSGSLQPIFVNLSLHSMSLAELAVPLHQSDRYQ